MRLHIVKISERVSTYRLSEISVDVRVNIEDLCGT